ncbi:MAG: heme biosynthesis protein HemY, partial [Betaproteobacteria bacterium]|nr:heme biosynthesis protein HemY [Betaproteobacteria bacterium]
GYKIETTFVVGTALLLFFAGASIILWSMVSGIFRIPSMIASYHAQKKRRKGELALSRGMIALGAGDADLARRSAAEAETLLGQEPLPLLLAAQSAQLDGHRIKAERAFTTMLASSETRLLGLRGLHIEAQRAGDLVNAIRYADEALTLSPASLWATDALIDYFVAVNEHSQALLALERGRRGYTKAAYQRKRAVILTARGLDGELSHPQKSMDDARDAVKLAPALVPASTLYARLLIRSGETRKAAKLLEGAWQRAPHPELAAVYLDLRNGDTARDRFQRARRLKALRPDHKESALVVAEAALALRDRETAQSILQTVITDRPSVRVCLLMADSERIGDHNKGRAREWLQRAASASPDECWMGDGQRCETWQPLSPLTRKLDQVQWTSPPDTLHADRALRLLAHAFETIDGPANESRGKAGLSAKAFLRARDQDAESLS